MCSVRPEFRRNRCPSIAVRQRAHLLPNRLTGGQRRYGGAKNVFTDAEWEILLPAIGPELQAELSDPDQARKQAMAHSYDLCGECHEEVLSEPVYLPSVMNSLVLHPPLAPAERNVAQIEGWILGIK